HLELAVPEVQESSRQPRAAALRVVLNAGEADRPRQVADHERRRDGNRRLVAEDAVERDARAAADLRRDRRRQTDFELAEDAARLIGRVFRAFFFLVANLTGDVALQAEEDAADELRLRLERREPCDVDRDLDERDRAGRPNLRLDREAAEVARDRARE